MRRDTAADFQALAASSPFPPTAYKVDISFRYLESTLAALFGEDLDLEPDFQRGHVWTDAQRAAYVEYVLAGGPGGRTLYFACEGWNKAARDARKVVVVDGKQRLEAVRRFLRGDLRVRDKPFAEWTGVLRMTGGASFEICIADVDRTATLRWYLALNRGGTPHTDAEISRVEDLLAEELAREVRKRTP